MPTTSNPAPAWRLVPPTWRTTCAMPVPPDRFGADHWSTFAYLETRTVDHRGTVDHDHLRCDPSRPVLHAAGRRRRASLLPSRRYPTRLKARRPDPATGHYDSVDLPGHDDYDCVADLAAAGLVAIRMPARRSGDAFFVDAFGVMVLGLPGDGPVRADAGDGPLDEVDQEALMAAATFALTERGRHVAAELRAHHADGGAWHQFQPSAAALVTPLPAGQDG